MSKQLALGLLALCTLLMGEVIAQRCPVEGGFQGTYNFGRESQSDVPIKNVTKISPGILTEIEKQLRGRVGKLFFKRLRFDWGYAVDFDSSVQLKAGDEGRIDGYNLVFFISDKPKGLSAFRFKVVADGKGKLIQELALPDIASSPQLSTIIPCSKAVEIARRNGFPVKRSRISYAYDWATQSFIWSVYDSKEVLPDEPSFATSLGTYRKILINANSGKVLRIYKETIAL